MRQRTHLSAHEISMLLRSFKYFRCIILKYEFSILRFIFIIKIMCMLVCLWGGYMHKSPVAHRSRRRASNSLVLQSHTTLSSLRWVGAGHELRSFARTDLALNYGAIAPAPKAIFFFLSFFGLRAWKICFPILFFGVHFMLHHGKWINLHAFFF